MNSEEYREEYRKALMKELNEQLDEYAKKRQTAEGREQLAREKSNREARERKEHAEKKTSEKRIEKIRKAAEKRTLWRLKKIVASGASDKELAAGIWSATRSGRLKHVRYLHEKGAGLDLESKNGFSLFMLAIGRNHIDVAGYLLENGANVNHTDESGNSALTEVLSYDYPNIGSVRFLISAGAKLNVRDSDGFSPLIRAIDCYSYDIAELLVRGGADVNFTDKNGRTPLMYAVEKNELRIVKWLVGNGARVNAKDNEGRSAAMYIRNYSYPSADEQIAFAKKNGVDLESFTSFDEAMAALKSSDLEYSTMAEERHISIDVPSKAQGILNYLGEKGMDLDLRANNGDTVIHTLVKKNYPFTYLLRSTFFTDGKCDWSIKDCNGNDLHQLLEKQFNEEKCVGESIGYKQ